MQKETQLRKGAKVRVTDGEFANKEGTIIDDCTDDAFCVNLSGFEVALVVTIEKSDLIPFEEDTKH